MQAPTGTRGTSNQGAAGAAGTPRRKAGPRKRPGAEREVQPAARVGPPLPEQRRYAAPSPSRLTSHAGIAAPSVSRGRLPRARPHKRSSANARPAPAADLRPQRTAHQQPRRDPRPAPVPEPPPGRRKPRRRLEVGPRRPDAGPGQGPESGAASRPGLGCEPAERCGSAGVEGWAIQHTPSAKPISLHSKVLTVALHGM